MNDASSDETGKIVKKHGFEVVTHVFNLGYGSALQLGYKYAVQRGYQYVIQMDADGQHDICNISKIYEELKKEDENGCYPDIVLGSRFMEGSNEYKVSFAKKTALKQKKENEIFVLLTCNVKYSLFSNHFKRNFYSHLFVKFYDCFVRTNFFNSIFDKDNFSVNIETLFFQSLRNLNAVNRTEDSPC